MRQKKKVVYKQREDAVGKIGPGKQKPHAGAAPSHGTATSYWMWASDGKEKPADQKPDIPQEIQDELVKNPRINAATFLNLIKSKGFSIQKKAVEADAGSSMPAATRAGTKEADKDLAHFTFSKKKESEKVDASGSNFKLNCKFIESAASDNGIGPTKFKAVLIQEGLGNMEDAFYYTRAALESAIPIFEGKQFFVDHPDALEEKTRPERSVRDIAGWFENVHVLEGDGGQAQLVADVNVLSDSKYSWVRSLLNNAVEFSKKYPDKDLVGLSINASGPAEQVELSEFVKQADVPQYAIPKLQKALEKGVTVIRAVNLLKEAISCDLVTRAGAGGRVLEMLEKEKQKMPKNPDKKESEMKAKKEADEKKLDKSEDGGGEDHPDAAQDADMIKKALKKHLGDDGDDEGAMKHAEEAYQYYASERGMEAEEAAKMASEAVKAAKHLAGKRQEAAKADAEESAKVDDYGYKYNEGEEKKEDEAKKKESELFKIKGELARLRESFKKKEVAEYMEKKLSTSGLPRSVTKAFKETIGEPKSEAEIDKAMSLFLEGYKNRSTSVSNSFVIGVEKQSSNGKGDVSLADCVKK